MTEKNYSLTGSQVKHWDTCSTSEEEVKCTHCCCGEKKDKYEYVSHPTHYNQYDKEVIDMMVSIWGKDRVADWCEMTAFKYRMRMGTKPENNIKQELEKEKWYLNKCSQLRDKMKE